MSAQETSSSAAPAAEPQAGATPAVPSNVSSSGPSTRRRAMFAPKRKVCRFCAEQVDYIDWKQFQLLRTFITERGRILSSRITGTCATHQRQLTTSIKRARILALLPFVSN